MWKEWNNMDNLVSIIVPIYNTEKYLEKCIKSLLMQSYQKLEIILVNDGSTDNSKEICEKYARNDKRILIVNKRNEGLELARKSGYQKATGEYIMHVDSDDYLPLNAVRILVENAEKENADIVIGNITRVIGNYGIVKKMYRSIPKCLITHEEMVKNYYISFFGVNILPVNVCGKLYRKAFLDSQNIRNIGLTHGEDLCYNIQVFPYARKTIIVDNNVYFYRWGGMTSQMNETLFEDARKAYRLKKEMLQKFEVEKGKYFIAVELKNFFVTYLESFFIYTQMDKSIIEPYIYKALCSDEMQDALRNLTEKEKAKEIVTLMLENNVEKLIELIYPQAIEKKRRRKYKHLISKCLYKFL